MARGKGHFRDSRRIPGSHQNSAVVGVILQHIDHILQLINSLTFVVVMHRLVLGAKMSPLEAVDRPQIPFLTLSEPNSIQEFTRCIAVPNSDLLIAEVLGICVAMDEPN